MSRIFISHTTADRPTFVDAFVERLRSHYLDTWFSPRDIPPGSWEQAIRDGLAECHWFLVVLTPNALQSDWVRTEVALALADRRYFDPDRGICRIVPVLAAACDWTMLHPQLHRCQLVNFTSRSAEMLWQVWYDLLAAWGVVLNEYPQYRVGDVVIPVYLFVGGDGQTRFRSGDVCCTGPDGCFMPPDDVRALAEGADGLLEHRRREAAEKQQVFVNNRQVRLVGASWGSPSPRGGLDNRPLRLRLGWTEYFHTVATNMNTDARLPDGLTVGQKYQSALDDLAGSRLSNPIAVNLSVVTRDGFLYAAHRSRHVAWNTPTASRPAYQPAVSGDGQPEDLDEAGTYDPFRTAIREAVEEATGLHRPRPEAVTFFGLARTFKTRFPFLFGELRVRLTAAELESQRPTMGWEGKLFGLPFTVAAVTDWVRSRYCDQRARRLGPAVGTTLFALVQSLLYAYPDQWEEVVQRLSLPAGSENV